MSQELPFWFKQALNETSHQECQSLCSDINTNVCIVGGGYTGLWTAIKIKQQSPDTGVTLIEKGICGQGASGRNGGCMLTFATKFSTLNRLFGLEEAIRLVKASEQAVFDIESFCKWHNIDADIRVDGAIYTATNNTQEASLYQPVSLLEQQKISRWQRLTSPEAIKQSGSSLTQAAITTDAAGSLHPGKLVLGLKKVALSLGVSIYENTPMLSVNQENKYRIGTTKGTVTADKVILAVNAWMGHHFPAFNRYYALVSSDMLITSPQPDALADIGLEHGKAVADSRIFVHYYRTTVDGRLMLGKGGNLFAFNNHMLAQFDQRSRVEAMLKSSFKRFFPTLSQEFESSWTGASDRSVTGLPFFGIMPGSKNAYYGLGYSGNGVVQSYLGGKILSSLALELDNSWTRSGLAHGPLGAFPPEPIRYIGANIVKHCVQRKESYEDADRKPLWLDKQIAKFAASAGKADK